MRNLYISILISLISLIFISCSDTTKKENVIFIDAKKVEQINLNEIFTKVKIIPLQSGDSSLISEIRNVTYWKDEFYILDTNQKSILVFNTLGRFSRKLHKVGKGPGEYLEIADFAINPYNNNIELVDGRSLYSYDKNGNFENKERIINDEFRSANEFEIINDNIIFFLQHPNSNISVFYSRKDKKIIKTLKIYNDWVKKALPFTADDRLYRYGGDINYLEGFSNKVYKIVENGYVLKYEWDFGKYNFEYENPALEDKIRSTKPIDFLKNYKLNTKDYITLFRNNIENNKFILTDFLFKSNPGSLLYNKINGNYFLFTGSLSNLLYYSIIAFCGDENLVIFIDPVRLKELPKDWFSVPNQKLIDEVNISDNPVLITLYFKKDLLN